MQIAITRKSGIAILMPGKTELIKLLLKIKMAFLKIKGEIYQTIKLYIPPDKQTTKYVHQN